jgi:two-component system cell cycle sensor histidine kinase/response regulator CckA
VAATVLVVDDIDSVRSILRRQLTEIGYLVLEASNGAEALDCLTAGRRIDLILTDLRMPEMDGRQLADSLAHRPVHPRVLFMSAFPAPEGVENRFLQKPFRSQDLEVAVQRALAS